MKVQTMFRAHSSISSVVPLFFQSVIYSVNSLFLFIHLPVRSFHFILFHSFILKHIPSNQISPFAAAFKLEVSFNDSIPPATEKKNQYFFLTVPVN